VHQFFVCMLFFCDVITINFRSRQKYKKMDGDDPFNRRNLLEFAKRGDTYGMEEMLSVGVPIEHTDHLGLTALHWAASSGHADAIKWLVAEKKANVNAKGKDGDTPLHKASFRGQESACKELVAQGADRRLRNKEDKAASDIAKTPAIKRICTPLPEVGATTNPLQRALEEAMAAAERGDVVDDGEPFIFPQSSDES